MTPPAPQAPDRGHIIWVTFDPTVGHEQGGPRPALVLTPIGYNRASGMLLACPITSRAKGYRSEVALPDGLPVSGVVLADQVRSLDWQARGAVSVCDAPPAVVAEVQNRLVSFILAS